MGFLWVLIGLIGLVDLDGFLWVLIGLVDLDGFFVGFDWFDWFG